MPVRKSTSTRSCSPGLEHLAKAGAEQLLVVVEQLPELVGQVGDLVEDVGTQGLSGSQARADEARDRIVRDALVEYPQRTPDERRLSVHEQRAKDVLVLGARRLPECAPGPLLELRRHVASLRDGGKRDTGDELVAVPRQREEIVRVNLALGDGRDGALEGLVVVEVDRIELVVQFGAKLGCDLTNESGQLALLHAIRESARSAAALGVACLAELERRRSPELPPSIRR